MFKFFSEEKLMLAVEYGVVLSETAKDLNIPLTRDLVVKLEGIVKGEFNKKSPTRLSVEMVANILAALEPKEFKADLGHCTGCTDPDHFDLPEGRTHQMGTIEHPTK